MTAFPRLMFQSALDPASRLRSSVHDIPEVADTEQGKMQGLLVPWLHSVYKICTGFDARRSSWARPDAGVRHVLCESKNSMSLKASIQHPTCCYTNV